MKAIDFIREVQERVQKRYKKKCKICGKVTNPWSDLCAFHAQSLTWNSCVHQRDFHICYKESKGGTEFLRTITKTCEDTPNIECPIFSARIETVEEAKELCPSYNSVYFAEGYF